MLRNYVTCLAIAVALVVAQDTSPVAPATSLIMSTLMPTTGNPMPTSGATMPPTTMAPATSAKITGKAQDKTVQFDVLTSAAAPVASTSAPVASTAQPSIQIPTDFPPSTPQPSIAIPTDFPPTTQAPAGTTPQPSIAIPTDLPLSTRDRLARVGELLPTCKT